MLHGLCYSICKHQHLVSPQSVNNHLLAVKTQKGASWMPPGGERQVSQSPAALSDREKRANAQDLDPLAALK